MISEAAKILCQMLTLFTRTWACPNDILVNKSLTMGKLFKKNTETTTSSSCVYTNKTRRWFEGCQRCWLHYSDKTQITARSHEWWCIRYEKMIGGAELYRCNVEFWPSHCYCYCSTNVNTNMGYTAFIKYSVCSITLFAREKNATHKIAQSCHSFASRNVFEMVACIGVRCANVKS